VAVTLSIVAGVCYLGGLLLLAFKALDAPAETRYIELDLMAYLLSLCAICAFSVNSYNNNLHMVLDLRIVMLLYSCLYQPRKKWELLRIPSFPLVMTLIVFSFMLFGFTYELTLLLGNVLYIVIGALFVREFRIAAALPTLMSAKTPLMYFASNSNSNNNSNNNMLSNR
jgi:hypothetical protein